MGHEETRRVLFVCSGNTCRSPMAAALLREELARRGVSPGDIEVMSAGTGSHNGDRASPLARKVLADRGADLSTHRSRALTRDLLDKANLILTMTRSHKAEILRISPDAAGKTYTLREFVERERWQDLIARSQEVYSALEKASDESDQERLPLREELRNLEVQLREMDIDDPWGGDEEAYVRVADALKSLIEALAGMLVKTPEEGTRGEGRALHEQ